MKEHIAEKLTAVMDHIEIHLQERLDLDTVAEAARYSKYHLHRMFRAETGITLHDYIRRRKLTEAAKLLAFSRTPIIQVSLAAGYESQQAFTGIFKAMYKTTPQKFREDRRFYPLQLPFSLHVCCDGAGEDPYEIAYATEEVIPDWLRFLPCVADSFPCLEEAPHRDWLRCAIAKKQALVMRSGSEMIAAAAYSPQTGCIDFLGIHPQYRQSAPRTFLGFIRREVPPERTLSVTTFRAGDRADLGQRAAYQRLGFVPSELLTEFGYPTQRMVLQSGAEEQTYV